VGASPEVAGVARAVGQAHVPSHAPPRVLARAVATAATAAPPEAGAVDDVRARAADGMALARLVLGLEGPGPELGGCLDLRGGPPAW
jgi:hypothetical protein